MISDLDCGSFFVHFGQNLLSIRHSHATIDLFLFNEKFSMMLTLSSSIWRRVLHASFVVILNNCPAKLLRRRFFVRILSFFEATTLAPTTFIIFSLVYVQGGALRPNKHLLLLRIYDLFHLFRPLALQS